MRIWAKTGTRPRLPADQRYTNAYLFGAICPRWGKGAALMLPFANTAAMQMHLGEISRNIAAKAHDRSQGPWRRPDGSCRMALLRQAQGPEKSHNHPAAVALARAEPGQNIWLYLRQNWLSSRVFADYDAIIEAGCQAWNKLIDQPETIMSIGLRDWAHEGQ